MNDQRGGKQLTLFRLPPAGKTEPASDRTRQELAGTSQRPSKSRAAAAGKRQVAKAYMFRVVLKWDRKVWRIIEVRGNQTLDDLHLAIQQAFGWDNDHLYAFFMSGKRWDQATEYADPRAEDGRSAAEVRIDALKLVPRKRFLYLFDYGDELLHDVWLVSVGPVEPRVKYPRIVKMHGEAPPQYPPYEDEG